MFDVWLNLKVMWAVPEKHSPSLTDLEPSTSIKWANIQISHKYVPAELGRDVGNVFEYFGCGGGPSPTDPRLVGLIEFVSGVRGILGRVLNAAEYSCKLKNYTMIT